MDEIRIQEADYDNIDDQHAIVELLDMYARDPMGNGEALGQDCRGRLVDGLRAHGGAVVLLARADGLPVGILTAFEGFSTFAARPLLNIHDIAVIPEYRGCGIGRRLLEAIEAIAMQRGCCRLTLEVRKDNPRAQRLYRQFGFGGGEAAMEFWSRPLG